jgi:hypothetical protein
VRKPHWSKRARKIGWVLAWPPLFVAAGWGAATIDEGDNFGPPPVAALLLMLLALILFLIWFVGLVVIYIRWLGGREPDLAEEDHSNR